MYILVTSNCPACWNVKHLCLLRLSPALAPDVATVFFAASSTSSWRDCVAEPVQSFEQTAQSVPSAELHFRHPGRDLQMLGLSHQHWDSCGGLCWVIVETVVEWPSGWLPGACWGDCWLVGVLAWQVSGWSPDCSCSHCCGCSVVVVAVWWLWGCAVVQRLWGCVVGQLCLRWLLCCCACRAAAIDVIVGRC